MEPNQKVSKAFSLTDPKQLNKFFSVSGIAFLFLVTTLFAVWASYISSESISWYRIQVEATLAATKNPLQDALILSIYTGFIKKLIALLIAGMLALLGLGLCLHALRNATTANAESQNGFKFSFSSVSPGVCAFLSATLIVITVVLSRDGFTVGAQAATQNPPAEETTSSQPDETTETTSSQPDEASSSQSE